MIPTIDEQIDFQANIVVVARALSDPFGPTDQRKMKEAILASLERLRELESVERNRGPH